MSNYRTIFMERATAKHGERYGYEMLPVSFTYREWVPIVCHIHGTFSQKARTHATGSGCPTCAHELREQKQYSRNRHTKEQFVERARKTHGDKYDYTKTQYCGQMKKVIITCPIHGDFEQVANNHVHGNGCAQCSDSRGERMISQILTKLGIEFERQKTFPECKNFSRKNPICLPFDFYVPSLNLLIEFDGKHHFEPVPFNGVSDTKAKWLHARTKEGDGIKNEFAKSHGFVICRISYLDSNAPSNLVDHLASAL